jgi:hypothetical protein
VEAGGGPAGRRQRGMIKLILGGTCSSKTTPTSRLACLAGPVTVTVSLGTSGGNSKQDFDASRPYHIKHCMVCA